MKIAIIAVGKLKKGAITDLCEDYTKRLSIKPKIIEIEIKKNVDPETLKTLEAKEIERHLGSGYVIALDERGRDLSSQELSECFTQDITFIIGGAYGLHPSIRDRADLVLSFGKATWPHQMVRLMLTEQLYRALSIRAGHPYHKV